MWALLPYVRKRRAFCWWLYRIIKIGRSERKVIAFDPQVMAQIEQPRYWVQSLSLCLHRGNDKPFGTDWFREVSKKPGSVHVESWYLIISLLIAFIALTWKIGRDIRGRDPWNSSKEYYSYAHYAKFVPPRSQKTWRLLSSGQKIRFSLDNTDDEWAVNSLSQKHRDNL